MKFIGRTKEGDVILALTPAEVERLYDGLDAENDRFEQWLREGGESQEDRDRLQKSLDETSDLNDAFQPVIDEIRGDKS